MMKIKYGCSFTKNAWKQNKAHICNSNNSKSMQVISMQKTWFMNGHKEWSKKRRFQFWIDERVDNLIQLRIILDLFF